MKLDDTSDSWEIDIDLTAIGFDIEDGLWTRRFRLPRHGDTEPVRFVVTPRSKTLGQRWVTLRLYHKGRSLGSVSRQIEVKELRDTQDAAPKRKQSQLSSPPSLAVGMASVGQLPVVSLSPTNEPPDLDVSIQYDDPDNLGPGWLTIRSYHKQESVSERINTKPGLRAYLEKEYARLVDMGSNAWSSDETAGKPKLSKDNIVAAVRGIGNTIYREYVPEQLKQFILLLERKNQITSIQISTNSPLLPWEIVVPDKRGNGYKPEFLGISFRLARWSMRGSVDQLEDPITSLAFSELHALVPDYQGKNKLPAQERELSVLKAMHGFELHQPNFGSLKLMLSKRINGFVHFAGHGDYTPGAQGLPLYSIRLSDGALDPITWREITKGAAFGNPFVFFNACYAGRAGSFGGFVQGWGPVVLSTGAGGFIGGQWPLIDEGAADFAQGFYQHVKTSTPGHEIYLADVLRDVRRNFYETGDPTYLAYALYGNANLR